MDIRITQIVLKMSFLLRNANVGFLRRMPHIQNQNLSLKKIC